MQDNQAVVKQQEAIRALSDNLFEQAESAWHEFLFNVSAHAADKSRLTGYGLSISNYARYFVVSNLDAFYMRMVSQIHNHLLSQIKNKYIYTYKKQYNINNSISENELLSIQQIHLLMSSYHLDQQQQKVSGEITAICCKAAMESMRSGAEPVFPAVLSYLNKPARLGDIKHFCRLEVSAVCNHAAMRLNDLAGFESVIRSVSGEHHNEGIVANDKDGMFTANDSELSLLWKDGRGYFPPSDFTCREIVCPGRKLT